MNKQSGIPKDDFQAEDRKTKENQQQEGFPPEIDKLKSSAIPQPLPQIAVAATSLGDSTQGKHIDTIIM